MGKTVRYVKHTTSCLHEMFSLNTLFFIGDIVHVETFGNHVIYLNTIEAANELLDKRSTIYSSRPRMVMIPDLYIETPFLFEISELMNWIAWDGTGRSI